MRLHSVGQLTPLQQSLLQYCTDGSLSSKGATQRGYRENQGKQRRWNAQTRQLDEGYRCLEFSVSSGPPMDSKHWKKTTAHRSALSSERPTKPNKSAYLHTFIFSSKAKSKSPNCCIAISLSLKQERTIYPFLCLLTLRDRVYEDSFAPSSDYSLVSLRMVIHFALPNACSISQNNQKSLVHLLNFLPGGLQSMKEK